MTHNQKQCRWHGQSEIQRSFIYGEQWRWFTEHRVLVPVHKIDKQLIDIFAMKSGEKSKKESSRGREKLL